jgi:hypothetical protein
MSILTPDLGTGQSVFNGALPLLTSDNSSDNMVSGSYSHLPIEWSATEANQIKSLLLYMISIAQSGISLPVRNATGSILPAGPVQVTGIDVTYNKWKIALADANANSPAQLLITSAMLADTGAWVLSTAYTTSKSARPTVPNGIVLARERPAQPNLYGPLLSAVRW